MIWKCKKKTLIYKQQLDLIISRKHLKIFILNRGLLLECNLICGLMV